MAKALLTSLLVSSVLSWVACGCTPAESIGGPASQAKMGTTFYCLDVSGSTGNVKALLQGRARQDMLDHDASRIEVFRFDQAVQELYTGAAPVDEEQVSLMLKRWFQAVKGGTGTSVGKMISRLDDRMQQNVAPFRVVIVTDCGTEMMSTEETKAAFQITSKWKEQGHVKEVRILGVKDGQREAIRKTIDGRLIRFDDE